MKVKDFLSSLFVFLLFFGNSITVRAQATGNQSWQASYWDNTLLEGAPRVQRTETSIDYNWGSESPVPGVIPSERFSARWTGNLSLPAGRYRFTVTVDDGARLWVNNRLLIDRWTVQARSVFQADIDLNGSTTGIRLEYFENSGQAEIHLSWQQVGTGTEGVWYGEYYNNTQLADPPALTRSDSAIDFNWGTGSPAEGVVAVDNFSVRWTSTFNLSAGRYRFTVTVDDGARLWVNDRLVLDERRPQASTTFNTDVTLAGGATTLRLEYFEQNSGALIHLSWARLSDLATPSAPPAEGAPVNLWHGEYFSNVTFAGSAAFIRNDSEINFNWGFGSPAPGVIPPDRFSVRWTRTLYLVPGHHQFTVTADDGVRLYVAGQPVIDEWKVQAAHTFVADVTVVGGAVPVELDYFENTDVAQVQLSWREGPPPTPTAPNATPVPPGGLTASVIRAQALNVRSGPGIGFGKVDLLAIGDLVELLGRNANATWIQIRLANGTIGWVNGTYLNSSTAFATLPVTY